MLRLPSFLSSVVGHVHVRVRVRGLASWTALAFGILCASAVACGGSDPDSQFGDGTPQGGDGTGTGEGDGGSTGGGDFTPGGSSDGGSTGDASAASDECKKMDLVFVVDNSGSMKQEQDNLVANFPKFATVIDQYKSKSGAPLEYRLAVTTTKPGGTQQGTFVRQRGASAPSDCVPGPDRPWLERPDGAIAGMFACRAQVGTKGGSPEQSLESVYLGLTARIADGTNTSNGQSFLRKDALLAFVAITDEDEGGTENMPARDMATYPGLFDSLKGGRGRWAAAVIAGEKKCSSPGLGSAAEAKRLKQFITDVGTNGVFSSICTGDLTEGLTQALATFDAACKAFPPGVN